MRPLIHDVARCEKTELLKGRETIQKLKGTLNDWKDSWFEQRDIIGRLWWSHPAIEDDKQRTYYQDNLKQLRGETTPKPWAAGSVYAVDGTITKDGLVVGRWKLKVKEDYYHEGLGKD